MEKEISEIIEKNLPAQVGDVLRKRLQQADEYEGLIKLQVESIKIKDELIEKQDAEIRAYKRFDDRNAVLDQKEKDVSNAQIELRIKTLEYQLDSEKDKTNFSKDVALGLVRNLEYRKSMVGSESQNGYTDSSGRWVQPGGSNKSNEETTSVK